MRSAHPVSAGFMRWITWLKCGVLAFLAIFAVAFRLGSWSHFVPFWTARPGSLPFVPALASAMVAGFFSFGGWWDVSKIAGEIRDPQRTLPRALIPRRPHCHRPVHLHQRCLPLPSSAAKRDF